MKIYSSVITGSLKIKGDIEAENYITKTTVTSMTQSFSSGSTIFGDSADDTHLFIGSKISGSSNLTGSFGAGFFADTVGMGVAPGNSSYFLNIEAAQTYAARFKSRKSTSSTSQRTMIAVGSGQDKGAGIYFSGPSSTNVSIGVKDDNKFHIAPGLNDIGDGSSNSVTVDTSGNLEVISGNIIASGNISGSSTSTGSFGRGFIADTLRVNSTDTSATPLFIKSAGTDTAVFNIDASDGIDLFRVDEDSSGNSKVVMRDTSGNADIQLATGTNTYFNNNGNFGIGLTSPTNKLHINHNSSTSLGLYVAHSANEYSGLAKFYTNSSNNTARSLVEIHNDNASSTAIIPLKITQDANGTAIETVGSGYAISGSSTSTGSFGRVEATTFSGSYIGQMGSRYVHSQTSDSATWSINHNIGHKYPVVTVYDTSDQMILPQNGVATDSDTFTLTFNEAIQGKAVVSVGGIGENAGAN